MTMTAFTLILLSVLLHAGWNFISKTGHPSFPFFTLFSVSIFLTMLPLNLWSGIPVFSLPLKIWLCGIGAGLCGGALFDVGLSLAYRNTDISISYPLTRALPVLFTVLITGICSIGKPLNITAVSGMGLLFLGCILTGIAAFRKTDTRTLSRGKGFLGILMAASGITGYTVLDSIGIRSMFDAAQGYSRLYSAACYSNMREIAAFTFLFLFSMIRKETRSGFNRELLLSWHPYTAGFFAALAYLLILLAMPHVTNVSYVQAFRQMSLPVGILLGVIFLKEKVSPVHLLGLFLIMAGLLISIL